MSVTRRGERQHGSGAPPGSTWCSPVIVVLRQGASGAVGRGSEGRQPEAVGARRVGAVGPAGQPAEQARRCGRGPSGPGARAADGDPRSSGRRSSSRGNSSRSRSRKRAPLQQPVGGWRRRCRPSRSRRRGRRGASPPRAAGPAAAAGPAPAAPPRSSTTSSQRAGRRRRRDSERLLEPPGGGVEVDLQVEPGPAGAVLDLVLALASGEAYMSCRVARPRATRPAGASASACRARWVATWPRVQPGSRLGAAPVLVGDGDRVAEQPRGGVSAAGRAAGPAGRRCTSGSGAGTSGAACRSR